MKEVHKKEFFKRFAPLVIIFYLMFVLFFLLRTFLPQAFVGVYLILIFVILMLVILGVVLFVLVKQGILLKSEEDSNKIRKTLDLEDNYSSERRKRLNTEKKNKELNKQIAKLKAVVDSKSQSKLIETTLKTESYKQQIEDCISSAKESIFIMSPHLDSTLTKKLIGRSSDLSVDKIKIITMPGEQDRGRFHYDALNELKSCFKQNVKVHKLIHARLIIVDGCETIIGSADLNSDSLVNKVEAGVWSKDVLLAGEATTFFNKIWGEK